MSANMLTLSIVIPAYNEESHLVNCLNAISKQTVKPDEVIVINNNSTDSTIDIAKGYHFVTVMSESIQGITFSRNAGFNAAKSDIIARIDADTILPPDWVERVKQFYKNSDNAHMALTGSCYFYNLHTGKLTASFYRLLVYRMNRLLLGHYFPWGSNSAIPRSMWMDVRDRVCNRADIHEDLDLGIHMAQAGYATLYKPKLRVGAAAKRVVTQRGELWQWLSMWPRTFKIHRIPTWPLVWPLVLMVWLGRYWIVITEWIGDKLVK
jgi:glycosyltransferase involved in cell wall biosynthesis